MKPGIKKGVSGKALRVATVFTGAAAAAGAFVPAAYAGGGHATAQRTYDQHAAGRHGARLHGIVTKPNCPGGTSNWIHLGFHKQSDRCYGFSGSLFGTVSRPVWFATSFCGGNNFGWISGKLTGDNNASWSHSIGHGTTYFTIPHTSQLALATTGLWLYSWSGHDTCKFP